MRCHFLAILVLPMMPFAVSPAAYAGEPPALSSQAVSDRDNYTQKAVNDMHEWDQRIHDLAIAAVASGKQVDSKAEDDLNVAWRKAGAAAHGLQTASQQAGDDGWVAAKSAYEGASRELGTAWHKLHPDAV